MLLDPYRPDFVEAAFEVLTRRPNEVSLEDFRAFIQKIEEREYRNGAKYGVSYLLEKTFI